MADDNKTPRQRFAEQHGEKAARKVDQALMRHLVEAIGEQLQGALIAEVMPNAFAYAIVCTDPATGAMAYGSNMKLGSMAEMLGHLRDQLLVRDAEAAAAEAKKV